MKHTMKSVMEAVEAARTEGNQRLPILTSNQCHALAEKLNAGHQGEPVGSVVIEVKDSCVYLRSGTLAPGQHRLYTHADPAEVERLCERMMACEEIAENNAKAFAEALTKLAEAHALLRDFCAHSALICGDLLRIARKDDCATTDPIRARAYAAMDHSRKVKKALSASAEPSAPDEQDCGRYLVGTMARGQAQAAEFNRRWEDPSAPVSQTPFERENRYIVLKRNRLAYLPDELQVRLKVALGDAQALLPHLECVVVEKDWPEYEQVWASIAARVACIHTPSAPVEQGADAVRQQHYDEFMQRRETRAELGLRRK